MFLKMFINFCSRKENKIKDLKMFNANNKENPL